MLSPPDLLAACRRHHDWLVRLVEDLVCLESPSGDKAALDRCSLAIADRAEALGWRTQRIAQTSTGDHLRAETGEGPRQVLLLGHFDTVWPVGQLARMPIRHESGRLHGPGVYDMKAGIGVALLAGRVLDELHARPACRVVLLLTSDEETGSSTSRALIEADADRSDAVLVLEPSLPGGGVKTARKGVGEYVIEAHGRAAHAGIEPQKGASAIVELARRILALESLQDLERGVTVNVGRVEGGTRPNVVADFARAEVDVRVPTAADADRVSRALEGLTSGTPGVTLRVKGGMNRPPLERTPGVVRLYDAAREVARSLGMDLAEGSTGGASDGNFTASRGVPTLDGLGPEGAGAHALDEHVLLEPLTSRAALLAGLLLRFT